jgi:hypothetical protein
VWALLPTLSRILQQKGEIMEKDFLPLGMTEPAAPRSRDRDELVLNRRRTVILSNPEVILREVEKKELKEQAAIDIEDKKLERKADAEARKANPKPKRVKKNVAAAVENVNV